MLAILALAVMAVPAWAATFPVKPAAGDFLVDDAGLVGGSDQRAIDHVAAGLLRDKQIPLYVVTLPSLAQQGATEIGIERYARLLFDHWGIGTQEHNYGLLLLVAQQEREIRIELGADWAGRHNAAARDIVYEIMIPHFKRGRFSLGIHHGVLGLDEMARDRLAAAPRRSPRSERESKSGSVGFGTWAIIIGLVVLAAVGQSGGGRRSDDDSDDDYWDGYRDRDREIKRERRRHRTSGGGLFGSSGSSSSSGGGWRGSAGGGTRRRRRSSGGSGGGGGSTGSW